MRPAPSNPYFLRFYVSSKAILGFITSWNPQSAISTLWTICKGNDQPSKHHSSSRPYASRVLHHSATTVWLKLLTSPGLIVMNSPEKASFHQLLFFSTSNILWALPLLYFDVHECRLYTISISQPFSRFYLYDPKHLGLWWTKTPFLNVKHVLVSSSVQFMRNFQTKTWTEDYKNEEKRESMMKNIELCRK